MATWIAAGLADLLLFTLHGVVGHAVLMRPLQREPLFATKAQGDADQTRRVLMISWHFLSVVFLASSVAFLLLATGHAAGTGLPHFLGAVHAAFFVTAVVIVGKRLLDTLRLVVPIASVICLATVAVIGCLS
ncbi:MAG: hypothetical protein ACKV2T_37105 [Kofleriaceae bacterium]